MATIQLSKLSQPLKLSDSFIADLTEVVDIPDVRLQESGSKAYDKTISDPVVEGCLSTLFQAVKSLDYELIKYSDTNQNEYELVEYLIDDWIRAGLNETILWAVLYGTQFIEVLWEQDKYWLPTKFQDKPHNAFHFKLNKDTSMWEAYIKDDNEGVLIPDYKMLVATFQPNWINPYGMGLLRKVYKSVFLKQHIIDFWSIFTEDHGQPKLTGKVTEALINAIKRDQPNMTNEQIVDNVNIQLENIRQNGVVAYLEGIEINPLDTGSKTHSDLHQAFIDFQDKQISIALLGHTGTSQSTSGKLGSEEAGMSVLNSRLDSYSKFIANYFNKLLTWVHEINFPSGSPVEIRFFNKDQDKALEIEKQKSLAERDQILHSQGVRFNDDYFQDVYKIDKKYFTVGQASELIIPNTQNKRDPHVVGVRAASDESSEDQETVDEFIEHVREELEKKVKKWVKEIVKFSDGYSNLSDINNDFYKVFDDLESKDFQVGVEKAILLMAFYGIESAQDERGASASKSRVMNRQSFGDLVADWDDNSPDDITEKFKEKGIELSDDYTDFPHQQSFTVTGVAKMDILEDFKSSIEDAMSENKTYREWKKDISTKLDEKGWTGTDVSTNHRLYTIFQTNMQSAFMDGRWQDSVATADLNPYIMFSSTLDKSTTKECKSLHRKVVAINDKNIHKLRPPGHFNCRRRTVAINGLDLKRQGLKVSTGISLKQYYNQKGFDKKAGTVFKPDLTQYHNQLVKRYEDYIAN